MRRLWLLACVAVLAGCGGSGGGGTTPPDKDRVRADLNLKWGARSRAFNAPSSALSATIAYLGAKPGGGNYTMTVDRPAELPEQVRTYRTTEPLEVGSTTVRVTFYADANGQGTVVGVAETPAQIRANGTLGDGDGNALGNIVTSGTVKSVVIPSGQRVKVDETKTLTFSARNAQNEVVAVSGGSFFVTATGNNLRINGDGTVTGMVEGATDVTVAIDGIQATSPVTVDPSLLEIVQTLNIQAKELVYSPLTGRVYATVSVDDAQYGGRVVAVDPINGTVTGSVDVQGDPSTLAIADDGKTLYVGLRDKGTIRSYNAVTGSLGNPIVLGATEQGINIADDIEVQPGHPETFVVTLQTETRQPRYRGMMMFDNGVARPKPLSTFFSFNRIAWGPTSNLLYGYDNDTALRAVGEIRADAEGLKFDTGISTFFTPPGTDVFVADGTVYTSTGGMCLIQDLTGIGELPLRSTIDQAGTVDLAAHRFYSINKEEGGVATLEWFSTATRGRQGTKTVPAFSSTPARIIAAGTNHVAVTTTDGKLVLIDHVRLD